MNRSEFEARLGRFGLALAVFQQSCYYGNSDGWSLTLRPYPSEVINEAKLTVEIAKLHNLSAVIDSFLVAAGVPRTTGISEALAARRHHREQIGERQVVVSPADMEIIIDIKE